MIPIHLKFGSQMGHKNLKGTVSIVNYKGRIRLRWRYQTKRYSLCLFTYTKQNLLSARKTAVEIEQDTVNNQFDFTLAKYKGEQIVPLPTVDRSIVEYFEDWATNYRQMNCDIHINYYSVRSMLRKWGDINPLNIHLKLNAETFSAGIYNRRLTMLKAFCKWLVKSKTWQFNPLEDINSKRIRKIKQPKRKPFTEHEITKVLEAIKNDTYKHKKSPHKHSHYYPFIYFIFKTGVRNAEAIGLRIANLDFIEKTICISEVMARTLKGSHAGARIRKETKNGKVRLLPMTPDLEEILLQQCKNKSADDLVFQSPNGLLIDDRMFLRRIFKPVLESLEIDERVLYACRHTFGSRCIDAGITPVMTAFLMGNNPETALRNYTHQITIPKDLPNI